MSFDDEDDDEEEEEEEEAQSEPTRFHSRATNRSIQPCWTFRT